MKMTGMRKGFMRRALRALCYGICLWALGVLGFIVAGTYIAHERYGMGVKTALWYFADPFGTPENSMPSPWH